MSWHISLCTRRKLHFLLHKWWPIMNSSELLYSLLDQGIIGLLFGIDQGHKIYLMHGRVPTTASQTKTRSYAFEKIPAFVDVPIQIRRVTSKAMRWSCVRNRLRSIMHRSGTTFGSKMLSYQIAHHLHNNVSVQVKEWRMYGTLSFDPPTSTFPRCLIRPSTYTMIDSYE